LKETNWSGFAMFEFKLTEDNELYLIEVNPRLWGSVNQGLCNGVNYFEQLLGEKDVPAGRNVNTYFSPFVYLSLLLYIFKGRFFPLCEFVKGIGGNKSDISIFADPKGWFGSLVRLI